MNYALIALVRKYSQVVQRYYVQYLSCYDGPALGQLLGNFVKFENESMILTSIYNIISSLSVKQGLCFSFFFFFIFKLLTMNIF